MIECCRVPSEGFYIAAPMALCHMKLCSWACVSIARIRFECSVQPARFIRAFQLKKLKLYTACGQFARQGSRAPIGVTEFTPSTPLTLCSNCISALVMHALAQQVQVVGPCALVVSSCTFDRVRSSVPQGGLCGQGTVRAGRISLAVEMLLPLAGRYSSTCSACAPVALDTPDYFRGSGWPAQCASQHGLTRRRVYTA
jgi:hypothetical protein